MPRLRRLREPLTTHALLQLVWLASPALPVGGFSYSEGLEAAVDAGLVDDETSLRRWLRDQLLLTLARCDLPAAAAAFKAWRRGDAARVAELNAWLLATRETAELRRQTEQMGRSLVDWLGNRGDTRADSAQRLEQLATLYPAPSWPVAFALAAERTGAPLREALLVFAFGWSENLVQAAIKAVPLGQSAGQRVLAALAEAVPEAVDRALRMPDSERQAYSPMLAIQSARHETQYSRLFRS
jgi:urease accessory protein